MNPYINYPFIVRDELIDYIKKQHSRNCRVKLYYTVRELTNHAAKFMRLEAWGTRYFLAEKDMTCRGSASIL